MTPIVPIRLSSRLLRISDRFMTFWFLSRLRRTIFPVTLTIFGGSLPAWLTRRLALSYSNIWGIFTALRLIFSGSRCKVLTGQAPSWEGWSSAPYTGLFTDAPRRRSGINLPSEFATEYSRIV